MSQLNDRPKDEPTVYTVIDITADVAVQGAGEVLAAAIDTTQAGGEAVCVAASSTGEVIIEVVGAILSSAGDVLG